MSNAMDDLYNVTNGDTTINAADHNTLVAAAQMQYSLFGGFYNFGNGRDGHLRLGTISITTSTAPTVALNGSGNLTAATYYYKYSAYNLSGETAASSASTTVAPSSQQVVVTIPAQAGTTNVTGFYIYRSSDNVTYYRIGRVCPDLATNGATFYDNYPITSGTAPSGSNTTSTSATTDGYYYCRDFSMASGQTLNVTNNTPTGLFICAQGDITISSGATISGTGKTAFAKTIATSSEIFDQSISSHGANGTGSQSSPGPVAVFPDSNAVRAMIMQKWNAAGTGGGFNSMGATNAGACIMLISQTQATIAGTVTISGANGTSGTQGDGGGAGGTLCVIAPYINRASATITANGGNGGNSSGTGYGGTGGGGGSIVFISDYLSGTATTSVNGGTVGTIGGSSSPAYGVGGSNGGNGGDRNSNGSVGIVATATLNQVSMF